VTPLAQAADMLVLGVVPYLSARKLAELYEPMRAQLQTALGTPVVLETAPDYQSYLARTNQGQYDIIATSPYFGRLAQLEQGYVPLARPQTNLEPLLVTRKDGATTLQALRGKVISTSDKLANLTLAAHRYLVQNGLTPGKDVTITPAGSHANSVQALLNGESAAAIISVTALRQLHPGTTARVRILKRLPQTTPLLYLAHRRLGASRIDSLRGQLFQFANQTEEGKAFCKELGHDGLKEISQADMKALDPYVQDLKVLLR
jgi:phosphonate transport system substrate-binding protein